MRKHWHGIVAVALAILTMAMAISCEMFMEATGDLQMQLEIPGAFAAEDGQARDLAVTGAGSSATVASWKYIARCTTAGADGETSTWTPLSVANLNATIKTLVRGTWTITVRGYNASGVRLLEGSGTATTPTSSPLRIRMLVPTDAQAKGTVSASITWDDSKWALSDLTLSVGYSSMDPACTAFGSWTDAVVPIASSTVANGVRTFTWNQQLKSGYHMMRAQLSNAHGVVAGRTLGLRVADGCTTSGNVPLDPNAPVTLNVAPGQTVQFTAPSRMWPTAGSADIQYACVGYTLNGTAVDFPYKNSTSSPVALTAVFVPLTELAQTDARGNLVGIEVPYTTDPFEPGGGTVVDTYQLLFSTNTLKPAFKNLKYVALPQVGEIPPGLFINCTSLVVALMPSGLQSIGVGAFLGCTNLISAPIPSNVTYIGDGAFFNCEQLADELKLPIGLTSIGTYMFANCPLMKGDLVIPNGVPSIGDVAFSGCRSLASVRISSNVRHIGYAAFTACDGFASISIPSSVMTIGEVAFSECANLKSVVISQGTTTIENEAFAKCTSLTSIIIPSSVTSIGDEAFGNCTSLTSVTLNQGTTTIGANTFSGCAALTKLAVPSSVTTIGTDAFKACTNMSVHINKPTGSIAGSPWGLPGGTAKIFWTDSFIVAAGATADFAAPPIFPTDKACVGYTLSGTEIEFPFTNTTSAPVTLTPTLVPLAQAVTVDGTGMVIADVESWKYMALPSSIKAIRSNAFAENTTIKAVDLSKTSATAIGEGAFQDCRDLVSITMPEGVTAIGNLTFANCTSLASITIPNSVASIDIGAFAFCSSLASFTIPSSVTSIGYQAFNGCSKLTAVTIPASVTSIGKQAFKGCSKLTSVTVPASVKTIGDSTFSDCTGLTSVTLNQGTTTIGANTFSGCAALTKLEVPFSVTSIGTDAFKACTNLSVYIDKPTDSITGSPWSLPGGVAKVFWNDSLIVDAGATTGFVAPRAISTDMACVGYTLNGTEVDFPYTNSTSSPVILKAKYVPLAQAVTVDGTGTVTANVGSWKYMALPSSIKAIGDYTFNNNPTIKAMDLSKTNATAIGVHAFYCCSSLASVAIPEGVVSIGNQAFCHCTALASIEIPNSVTSIGKEAFGGCSNLASVTIPESVTSIGEWVFYGCSSLASVTIPDSVTSIGACAFYFCTSLASVVIPEGVKTIGERTFYNCSALASVVIPEGVTSIGVYAFYGCSSLASVNIGKGVTSIGGNAFQNCSSLTSVVIPNSVTSIGNDTFLNCPNLSVYIDKPMDSITGSPWGLPGGTAKVFWLDFKVAAGSTVPFEAYTAIPTDKACVGYTLGGTEVEFPFTNNTTSAVTLTPVFVPLSQAVTVSSSGNVTASVGSWRYLALPSSVKSISDNAFSSNTTLRGMDLSKTSISSATISNISNLQYLKLTDKDMSSLSLQNLPSLVSADLRNLTISGTLSMSGNYSSLRTLNLDGNTGASSLFANMQGATFTDVSISAKNCGMSSSPGITTYGATQPTYAGVTSLDLSGNTIGQIQLSTASFPNLKVFKAEGQGTVTDMTIGTLTYKANAFTNSVAGSAGISLNLSYGLPSLEQLHLKGNGIWTNLALSADNAGREYLAYIRMGCGLAADDIVATTYQHRQHSGWGGCNMESSVGLGAWKSDFNGYVGGWDKYTKNDSAKFSQLQADSYNAVIGRLYVWSGGYWSSAWAEMKLYPYGQ